MYLIKLRTHWAKQLNEALYVSLLRSFNTLHCINNQGRGHILQYFTTLLDYRSSLYMIHITCVYQIYTYTHIHMNSTVLKKTDGSFYVNINLGIGHHRVGVWEYY